MEFFQDHMPGNICFGCGAENSEGLKIKSYWQGDEACCEWLPQSKYQGWTGLLNGGIMATLIDCHCMGTAIAHAYRAEDRSMGSEPEYRYATGTMEIKYLKPTSSRIPVLLKARVTASTAKKTVMTCDFYSDGQKTAEAQVIAIKVYDSSQHYENNQFDT
ncbi:MAG: PaaI family thioesterase [Bacteroidota bacterium]